MANDGAPLERTLREKIDELADTLAVNNRNRVEDTCVRDSETGAIICVRKKYVGDMVHQVHGFAKVGDKLILTKGNSKEIRDLMDKYRV